jgi:hypothetical protein
MQVADPSFRIDSYKFPPRNMIPDFKAFPCQTDDFVNATPVVSLKNGRVALLTSGGLYLNDRQQSFDVERERREPFWGEIPTYRVISRNVHDEIGVAHLHLNPDHIIADFNIALTLDLFAELDRDREVGSLSENDYSFMGYQGTSSDQPILRKEMLTGHKIARTDPKDVAELRVNINCFSYGDQRLWQGDLFWKMPDDAEIHVGQQHPWTLPKPYVEATEKYGSQTRLTKQPDGRYKLENYVAGLPFPNPSDPDKGTMIAANVTYKMQGYQWGQFMDMGAAPTLFTKDRFGNAAPSVLDFTYMQTAYNWESDQGVPSVNPQAAGSWYTQWIMQQTPEQSKYTTVLTIFWQDNGRRRLCLRAGPAPIALLQPRAWMGRSNSLLENAEF